VILATGVSSIAPSSSMRAGVMAYLVKPFTAKALVDATSVAIAWHDEAVAKGPKPDDVGDKLSDWLDALDDL
jgi:FixJ family two-component response regulator